MKKSFAAALRQLQRQLPAGELRLDAATLAAHAGDKWFARHQPQAVALPRSTGSVAKILRFASQHRIPVTARGAGHGYVGGCVPTRGGIVLSLARMNRIKQIHAGDSVAVVQPGVITQKLQDAVEAKGLFYPPDPASRSECTLGGSLATNAGGPRCLKYGVTRDYVLGLRAVTGDGQTIRTGCRTTKGVTGYDLTRLLVGSGGTLALITEATLKLLPAPEAVATLRVCFAGNHSALDAVGRVMHQSVMPCALEFMDHRAIDAIRPTGTADDLPEGTRALLMVEADGAVADLPRQIAALERALAGDGLLEMKSGFTRDDITRLWAARKSLSHAVKQIAPLKINEDVVVPVSELAGFVDFIDHTANAHRLAVVSFGHAGNGNLHVNLMVHPDDADEMERAHLALDAIMLRVLALGGTLSGEHGIGTEKRRFVPQEIDPATLDLMRAINRQFDPHGLLNPGKLFPD